MAEILSALLCWSNGVSKRLELHPLKHKATDSLVKLDVSNIQSNIFQTVAIAARQEGLFFVNTFQF